MKIYLTASLLVISMLTAGCNFTLAADVTPPPGYQEQPIVASQLETTSGPLYPLVPPNPSVGKGIFAEKCAPCHGDTGLGDGPRSQDLPNPVTPIGSVEIARAARPTEWFNVVTEGNLERFMPPFPSLTDRQKWDVIAYTFGLSMSSQSLDRGAQLFQKNCLQCHGVRGKGDGVQAAGMSIPDFSRQEFMAGKSGFDFFKVINDGISPSMPAFGDLLSVNDRWDLANYVRSLSFAEQTVELAVGTPKPSKPQLTQQAGASLTATEDLTQTLGLVQGIVTNASGGTIPAGSEVLLHAFDQMQLVMTATAVINQDGSYAFDQVEMKPGRSFFSTIDYDGVLYGSEFVAVEDPTVPLDLPLEVFDSTSDPSILSVDRLHYFFEFLDDSTVRVVELYIISNPTKKTLIAQEDGQPIVHFSLPVGASELEFQDGELGIRYVKTDDGFGDTTPVRPGEGAYQVLYSYALPYDRKLELNHQMSMDTKAIVILVPEDSIKVKGVGIEDGGTREVQGAQYHMYNGSSFKKGDELRLTVTGRPSGATPAASISSNQNLIVGIGILGLVLIFLGIWMFQRNRSGELKEPISSPSIEVEYENTESVMDAILALDDLYQEGLLPEDAYLERRGELKEQLKLLSEKRG